MSENRNDTHLLVRETEKDFYGTQSKSVDEKEESVSCPSLTLLSNEYELLEDEEDYVSLNEDPKVTLTKHQELSACISDAVNKAISSVTDISNLARILTSLSASNHATMNLEIGNRLINRRFCFPPITNEDKLTGTKNYVVWRQRLDLVI